MNGNPQPLIVDANVVVKWYVEEDDSGTASRLMSETMPGAPDFLLVEVANVFAKKLRSSEMRPDIAREALLQIPGLVGLTPATEVLDDALSIALDHGRSIYDSLYVALALREQCQLVTADERLVNALRSRFPDTMLWLRDLPS